MDSGRHGGPRSILGPMRGLLRSLPWLALATLACREPTQIQVTVSRDFPCNLTLDTGIRVGSMVSYRSKDLSTHSARCAADDPEIGTVVITPSGGRKEEIAFEVVAGLGIPVEDCLAPAARQRYTDRSEEEGCIWAARSLYFMPHETVEVPIVLRANCKNVPCDESANSVCVNGDCKPIQCPLGDTRCTEETLAAGSGGAGPVGGSGGAGDTEPLTGFGTEGPSCTTEPLLCQGESCCLAPAVPGGIFAMGRDQNGVDAYDATLAGVDESPPRTATVASFYLDKYEVTVGRFRPFVAALGAGWEPAAGAGAHPSAPNSGWTLENSTLAAGLYGLQNCEHYTATWTETPGPNEELPLTCVSWPLAFAFCVWDGGRLPLEVEWEYAAAGGDAELTFPDARNGRATPTSAEAAYSPLTSPMAVGETSWRGRWGHADLAGNTSEWTRDGYVADAYSLGGDCALGGCFVDSVGGRVTHRGGSVLSTVDDLRTANRSQAATTDYSGAFGVRCARDQ